mgnify:CR=1 FL=1
MIIIKLPIPIKIHRIIAIKRGLNPIFFIILNDKLVPIKNNVNVNAAFDKLMINGLILCTNGT